MLPFRRDNTAVMPSFVLSNLENSCVNWSSSNPSIIKVSPIYENGKCSKSANIEVLYIGKSRMNTIVFAESEDGQRQSCNVYTDEIKQIEILTSTRTIYVDTLPQIISLQGFDGKQNIFTSIGHDANWIYDTKYFLLDKSSTPKNPLNPTLSLKGISVGKSVIQAKLNNLVATAEIAIVEQINLFPPNYIRVLPDVDLPFKLCTKYTTVESQCKQISKNLMNQYNFKSSDNSIITINQDGNSHTHAIGVASITASDILSDDNVATTVVNVTLPYSGFQKKQYILQGTEPVFNPKVFDEYGAEIYGADQIKWTIEGEWKNLGENLVTFRYFTFSFTAIVVVCSPISINPSFIVLPPQSDWFTFGLTGGSGFYNISILDKNLADVGNRQIKSFAAIGETKLVVVDQMIEDLKEEATVMVSPVKSAYILMQKRELFVNDVFEPQCKFTSESGHNYSVPLQHEAISTNVLIVDHQMIAKSPGFAGIYCSSRNAKTQEILVSVINPLRYEVRGRASPNSHIPLHYTGGPLKWEGQSPPDVKIECGDAEATVSRHFFSLDREFSGNCTLKIANRESNVNPIPLHTSVEFHMDVSNLNYLRIFPVDPSSNASEICNLVPSNLTISNEVVNVFRAIPNHVISFNVFCFDSRDNIINYYSANPITFTADDSFIERVLIDEDTGNSVYKTKVTKTIEVTAHADNAIDSIVTINVITPIVVESSKMAYYSKGMFTEFAVTGGSGHFKVFGQSAQIFDNGSLIVRPQTVGHFEYVITDICTDELPVKTALDIVTIDHLEIECARKVIVNSEVIITVNAYTSTGRLIPETILESANINLLEPKYVERLSYNKWLYKPDTLGEKIATATATGCSKASKTIIVVDPIIVNPTYVVILPQDIVEIYLVSTNYDVALVSDDGSIARVFGFSIVGVSPGNTTVRAIMTDEPTFPPAIVHVRVLRPIELIIEKSSEVVISGGSLFASLLVVTDLDTRYTKHSEMTATGCSLLSVNASHAILSCNMPGIVNIQASAYSLRVNAKIHIEEKFELLCPNEVIICPGAYFEFKSRGDVPFTLTSDNGSVIIIDGHFGKSVYMEGSTVVRAYSGVQSVAIVVDVISPASMFLNRTALFVFRALLVDKYGRFFTSLQGITFSLTGQGFTSGNFDNMGYVQISTSANASASVTLSASTALFSMEKIFTITTVALISPSGNVTVMKGAQIPFTCTLSESRWSVSDPKVAKISENGQLKALQTGFSTVSCDKKLSTDISVITMKNIKLEKVDVDQFEVIPIFDVNPSSRIYYPSDISLLCSWDSENCGRVRQTMNTSGFFCTVERLKHSKCPEFSVLKANIVAPSSGITLTAQQKIPFIGLVDFGVANWHVFSMDKETRKSVIDLNFGQDSLDWVQPEGWSVSFRGHQAIVRAPGTFKGVKTVTFKHRDSGEKLRLKFEIDSLTKNDSGVRMSILNSVTDFIILLVALAIIATIGIISWKYN